MRVSDFDFELPVDLIAQEPAEVRDQSRLLVLRRDSRSIEDRSFADIEQFLDRGDLLVVNDTRVFPARLRARRDPTGGRVELFLVEELGDGVWEVLARPAARLRPGDAILAGEGPDRITGEIVPARSPDRRAVRFHEPEQLVRRLEIWGETPLPPYIHRGSSRGDSDRERYQTVYARERGAVAAPTAGLHFTGSLLDRISAGGVERAALTLHVGYGTFQPVRVDVVEEHQVEPERYEIPKATVDAIDRTRSRGGRVVAVGTTTTRALENAADERGRLAAGPGLASLFIHPGHSFRCVDALVTNFHLPRSSLLMLVSAFAGRDLVLEAYRHAVAARYRFYSYGDAMLILP